MVLFWKMTVILAIAFLPYNLYREMGWYCGMSSTAPLWEIHSAEFKPIIENFIGDERTFINETKNKSMKFIQNAALYILGFNCGIIAYWFGKYKPIFNDFRKNHGAKHANGERNGHPRTQSILGCQIPGCDKFIGLNRSIILVTFLLKIIIPFVDSITGKFYRQGLYIS